MAGLRYSMANTARSYGAVCRRRRAGAILPCASVPAQAAATTPATAVSHGLSAGAYVPEWSQGQELVQYLAQLEGREYAVVDHHGRVTGLLRQSAVVTAITGKEMRRSGRAKVRNR